jgi:hypothetical protein
MMNGAVPIWQFLQINVMYGGHECLYVASFRVQSPGQTVANTKMIPSGHLTEMANVGEMPKASIEAKDGHRGMSHCVCVP